MATQKYKKNSTQIFIFIFECLLPQNPSNLSSLLIDSSRSYKRLLKNKKTGGSRELFLPENDFQTSSTANFPKNIQILEAWKPTEDMKFRIEFFFYITL